MAACAVRRYVRLHASMSACGLATTSEWCPDDRPARPSPLSMPWRADVDWEFAAVHWTIAPAGVCVDLLKLVREPTAAMSRRRSARATPPLATAQYRSEKPCGWHGPTVPLAIRWRRRASRCSDPTGPARVPRRRTAGWSSRVVVPGARVRPDPWVEAACAAAAERAVTDVRIVFHPMSHRVMPALAGHPEAVRFVYRTRAVAVGIRIRADSVFAKRRRYLQRVRQNVMQKVIDISGGSRRNPLRQHGFRERHPMQEAGTQIPLKFQRQVHVI